MDYTQFELDNGLRVVHSPDPSTAMAGVTMMYDVGSRDERPERTGMAHLFEHLMFGGSANVPDFDGSMERAGGQNNAWTSCDHTCFHESLPAQNIETALWLESDRMLRPTLVGRVLEVQRDVVVEEFKQTCLNAPYGDLQHHLRALLYEKHPYRWPTIGLTPEHVASVTDDEVERFFNEHYSPDRAVLALTGRIEAGQARELAEKWFGDIPRRATLPRDYVPEPLWTGERRNTVTGHVPDTVVTIAFPMAAYGTDDFTRADLITDILAAGRGSRLYGLAGQDGIVQADSSIIGSDEPGFLMVSIKVADNDDATIRRAEARVLRELDALAATAVDAGELRKVQNKWLLRSTMDDVNYMSRGLRLVSAVLHREAADAEYKRMQAVTPDALRTTAESLFAGPKATLVYRPDISSL